MLTVLGRFVAARAGVLAAVVAFAAGHRCASHAPGAPSLEKLGAVLGRSVGGVVSGDAIAWAPGRGVAWDLLIGRDLLFIGAPRERQADVFRARWSVTPEGQPLRLVQLENLTRTADAAEQGLLRVASYVGYSTVTAEGATTLSLVDFSGAESPRLGCLLGECPRPLAALHLAFEPVGRVSMLVDPPRLKVKLGAAADVEHRLDAEGVPVWRGVDAWRGELGGDRADSAPTLDVAEVVLPWRQALREIQPPPSVTPQAPSVSEEVQWPPLPLSPLVPAAAASEGTWRPVDGQAEEPTLLSTQLSLDPARPDSRLHLIAMDLRRLDLRLQGGVSEPYGTLGPAGTGRLPAVSESVVAVFGGGDVHAGSARALKVDGRSHSPPGPGVPSVVITQRGDVGLGRWPRDLQADAVISYRQSEPLLVSGGESQVLRGARELLVGKQAALCRTAAGHLLYAWTNQASWAAISLGLVHAGCQSALALDSERGGFAIQDGAESLAWSPVNEHVAFPSWLESGIAQRDFFYLSLRPRQPKLGGLDWIASPGAQPSPTLLPAILGAASKVGDLQIELVTVSPERVGWSVLGGGAEPLLPGRAAPTRELTPEERDRVLFAFDAGHTTRATRYGLAFGARETLPLRRNYATLVVGADGLELAYPGEPPQLSPAEHALQLPLLVSDGQLTERASRAGSHRRRGALCVAADGRVLAAFAQHDSSAPLALELRRLGCDSVCELDRASQHQAEFYREGTRRGLPETSDTTLIVGLSKEMSQPTFDLGR